MDSSHLTTDQAEQVRNQIRPALYNLHLHRLRERIDQRGFPRDDELRQRVEQAHEAVHRLWVKLHYMSCKGSVGRPSKDRKR